MTDSALPLVVAPDVSFGELESALGALGYERDPAVEPFTEDMLPGEPELAAWTRGDETRLTYTFNPVVGLRVLTPTAPGEVERARLVAGLRLLSRTGVARLLAERDKRQLLLGLLATRIMRCTELRGSVAPLLGHSESVIAEAARAAYDALVEGGEVAARQDALRLLQVLCEQAIPVLAALKGPEAATAVLALRPRAEDYALIFLPEVAEILQQSYDELWREPPRIASLSPDTVLHVEGCPAWMFGSDNELSRHFPGGYRALAPYLQPNRVWFVWRYLETGKSSGIRYDGLVRIDDRQVWLPKPYRVLGERRHGPLQ
jgi:hypothetical protein